MQTECTIETRGRGWTDLSERIARIVSDSGVDCGVCHAFLRHTSASLLITENADPEVRRDLERYLARLVPDGDPLLRHDAEGPDDMPAHIRAVLAGCTVTAPVRDGRLALGTWQGIYLWEHRVQAHRRSLIVTVTAA